MSPPGDSARACGLPPYHPQLCGLKPLAAVSEEGRAEAALLADLERVSCVLENIKAQLRSGPYNQHMAPRPKGLTKWVKSKQGTVRAEDVDATHVERDIWRVNNSLVLISYALARRRRDGLFYDKCVTPLPKETS